MAAPDPVDYYETLAIEPESDEDGIRQAVFAQRRLWLRRQNAPRVEQQRMAEDRLRIIAEAEEELLDPTRRAAYDRQRAATLVAPPPGAPHPSPTPPPVTEPPPAVPAPPPPPPREPGIDWIRRALGEFQRGDLRSARYSAAEATERNPRNAQAWMIRGSVSKAQSRFDDAVFEFGEASGLAPSADVFFQLAEANEAAGYPEQAGAAFHSALQHEPGNPDYAVALANFWVRQNRPEVAVEVLEPVHQREPNHTAVATALGYAMLYRINGYLTLLADGTTVFTSAQQVAQAEAELHRALSLPLDDRDLINRLSAMVNEANQASRRRWAFPSGNGLARLFGWSFLVLMAFAIPATAIKQDGTAALLSVALVALIGWGFFRIYRKPGWARNASQVRPVVKRWGI